MKIVSQEWINWTNTGKSRRVAASGCRHPAARRVVVEHWQTETTTYDDYPCECGGQPDGVAYRRESTRTDWGYTTGHAEDDCGPTSWDRPETTETEYEVVEEEQCCDCFPDWPDDWEWDNHEDEAEVVESAVRERCEACGQEWDA